MKKSISLIVMLLVVVVAMGKDIKTVAVTTEPLMHCESCEMKIKNNLRFEKGVKKIETNIERQTVTITYDAEKTNVDKLLKSFEKIKYKARKKDDNPNK